MTAEATPSPPPTFNCRERRHKVITADAICCLCGARGVVDARMLPAPPPVADPSPLAL